MKITPEQYEISKSKIQIQTINKRKACKKRGRKPKIRKNPSKKANMKRKARNDQNFVPFVIRYFYTYLIDEGNLEQINSIYKKKQHLIDTKKELSRIRNEIKNGKRKSRQNMKKLFGNENATKVERNNANRHILRYIINEKYFDLVEKAELDELNFEDYLIKLRILNYLLLDGDLMNYFEQTTIS